MPPEIQYGVVTQMDEFVIVTTTRDGRPCPNGAMCTKPPPEGFRYASVHCRGGRYELGFLAAAGVVKIGDIVKIEMPTHDKEGRVVEVIVKKGSQDPNCHWVDGAEQDEAGGIECRGWSYKTSGS